MTASKAEEIKELNRLLELKKLQETQQVLNQSEMMERLKLEMKHLIFAEMTSEAMKEELKKKSDLQEVTLKSDDFHSILQDHKKRYGKESWYQEPKEEKGGIALAFPSEEAAGNFCKDQAEKNRSFMLIDPKTNKVLAYSNGDGKLYNGDGSVYQSGSFKASQHGIESFIMPEPVTKNGMNP